MSRARTVQRPHGDEVAGQFSLLFQDSPLPVWVFDRESLCFLEVNRAAVKHYGYSRDEFLGMRITGIHPPQDVTRLQKQLEKRRAGPSYSGEWKHRTKDGRILKVEATAHTIRFNGHEAVLVIAQDVTKRKRVEGEFGGVPESAPDAIVVVNQSRKIIFANTQTEDLFGYTRQELLDSDIDRLVPERLRLKHHSHFASHSSRPRSRRMGVGLELSGLRKDGTEFPVDVSLGSLETMEGLLVMAAIRDVTGNKRIERALREAEDRYRSLVEQLPMIVYTNAANDIGSTRYVSPQVEDILGYSPQEWLADPRFWQKALHPDDRQRVLAEIKRADQTGEPLDLEYRMLARDGRIVWFRDQSVPNRDAEGKSLFWHGFMVDVSERKQAEEAVRESEAQYRLLFDATPIGIGLVDMSGNLLAFNEAMLRPGGYSREDIRKIGNVSLLYADPAQRSKVLSLFGRQGYVNKYEVQFKRKDGSVYDALLSLAKVEIKGRPCIQALVEDVTERRRSEVEIERRNQDLTLMNSVSEASNHGESLQSIVQLISEGTQDTFDTFGATLLLLDRDRQCLVLQNLVVQPKVIAQIEKILGAPLPRVELDMRKEHPFSRALKERKGILVTDTDGIRNLIDTFVEDAPLTEKTRRRVRRFIPALIKVLNYTSHVAIPLISEEALIGTLNLGSRRHLTEDDLNRLAAISSPLTSALKRKLAEDALRESEERFRSLYENVTIGLYRTTPEGKILLANPALVKMLGYESFEQLAARDLEQEGYEPDYPRQRFKELLEKEGEVRGFESAWARRDGTVIYVRESARAISDHSGRILYYEGTVEDVTERMRTEEALRASEAELRALFAAIPDVILVLDKDGRYLEIAPTNPDLPYMPSEEVLGKRMHDIFSRQKADQFVKHIRRALRTRGPVQFEYALLIRDRIMWFSGAVAPLTKDTVVWAARDITPRKEAEEQVERRLNELEALHESALSLSQSLDPKEIGQKVIKVLSGRLNWHHAAVRVRHEDSDEVELLAFSQTREQKKLKGTGQLIARQAIARVGEGISGWVIQHGRMVNSGNLEEDPRYHETFAGMHSGLYAPIWAGGRVLGCISVESSQHEAFSEADERLLTTLASQAAIALENARLFAETQHRAVESASLYEVTRDLTTLSDLRALLETIAGHAASLLKVPGGAVYLHRPEHNDLEIVVATHDSLPIGTRLAIGEGLAGLVAEKREPIIVDDYEAWENRPVQYRGRGFAAVLEVPMLYGGELVGVLVAYDLHSGGTGASGRQRRFTEQDMRLLSLFAGSAAGAVYSARLLESERLRRQDAETLRQAAASLASSLDLEKILEELLDGLAKVISYDSSTVFIRERENLRAVSGRGLVSPAKVVGHIFPATDELTKLIWETRRPVTVDDIEADPRFEVWESQQPIRGWMGVPLIARGEVIGYLTLDSRKPNVYTGQDAEMALAFASQAAAAIENARLYREAVHAAERRAILHEASQEIARLSQNPEQLYIAIHHAASQLMPAEAFTIVLLQEEHHEIEGAYLFDRGGRSPVQRYPFGKGFSSQIINRGESILIDDYHEDQVEAIHFGTEETVRSILAVPMRVSGKVMGAMSAQSYQPGVYNAEDRALLEMLAAQAAIAIQNARLFEQTQRRAQEFETLYGVTRDLSSHEQDLPSLLQALVERAVSLMGAYGGGMYLYDAARNDLELAFVVRDEKGRGARVALGEGAAGHVAKTRMPLVIDDYQTWKSRRPKVEHIPFRALVQVPMLYGGELIGVLDVFEYGDSERKFSEQDVKLLSLFAAHAASAVHDIRLFEKTRRSAIEFASLYETARDMAAQQDSNKLLDTIVKRAGALLNSPISGIYLYDESRKDLYVAVNRGLPSSLGLRLALGEGVAGRVAQSRQPMIIDDYQTWEGRSDKYAGVPIRSVLEVPMLYGGELIGVLTVDEAGDSERKFTEDEAHLLSLFASHAASAVYNARLLAQSRRRAEEFASLYETARDVSAQQDLKMVLATVVERASGLLSVPDGGIYLYDAARNDLELAVTIKFPATIGSRIRMGEGVAGRVAQTREPILIEDYRTWEGRSPTFQGVPFRAVLEVPMLYGGELIGVLAVDEIDDSERKFSEVDARLLSLFASHAASAIYSARLLENARRRAEEFKALYEITHDVSLQQDITTLLTAIVERATKLLETSRGGIYLFDAAHGDLVSAVRVGMGVLPALHLQLGEGAAGRVAQMRQPIIIDDYQTWEGRSPKYDGVPFRAILQVPMLYGGELIGVITVDEYGTDSTRKFTEADARLLSLFASTAASAIYSARLLENTRRRAEELETLSQVSSALRTAPTRAQMVPIILTQLRQILHADGAMFVTLNPASGGMAIELSQGSIEPRAGLIVPAGEELSAQVIRSRQIYTTSDLHRDPRLFQPDLLPDVRCAAIVPLIAQDHDIGVLWVTRDHKAGVQPAAFTPNEVNLLVAIADMAANAIQRASLHEQTAHYARQLVTINAMGHALSQMLDLPGICEKVERSVLDLLPDTAAVFISFFDRSERLITAAYGLQDGRVVHVGALPPIPFDEAGAENQSRVILNGQPLIVPDLIESLTGAQAAPVSVTAQEKEQRAQSALYVPLQAEGQVIGILQLQSHTRNRYAAADAELLGLVATTAAAAIQNARLFAQLRQRVDQLSALHTVDAAISSTTDLRISLQTVLENITRQLSVDAASVLLLNPATLTLQHIASEGFLTSQITRASFSLGKGQAGAAALERRIIRIPDLAAAGVEFARSSLVTAEKFAAYLAVPLIAKGEVKGVLEIFHRTPLDLDEERTSFLEMLAGQAALAIDNALLFEGLERANVELTMAYDATIEGWSQALELRDQETRGHSTRVLELTLRLAAAMGLSDKELKDIRRGVLLHDIGKMGIPDSILHKAGPLTGQEWEIMRKHPQYAYDMLAPIAYLRNSLDIPYCHHEKWDGTGYPRALKGETIPLAARIFSIVDVCDALTSDRPYRAAWPREKAIAYILEQSGKHFDPGVVEFFMKVMDS